jgi:hypothetical protein
LEKAPPFADRAAWMKPETTFLLPNKFNASNSVTKSTRLQQLRTSVRQVFFNSLISLEFLEMEKLQHTIPS